MALMVKCRSPQIRSCPCSIFSGVSVPLARKRDTSPEIISDLDGRLLFKVHILTTCFVASIRAVASPHRCTAKSAPVPIGGGVEMCLNLGLLTKCLFIYYERKNGSKKDALWRHPMYFIILFKFKAVAERRQWSSAASKPRRKMRVKLCPHF